MLRRSSWHVASWLDARLRKKLGIRMAAKITKIATTIRSSMRVNPACPRRYRTCVCTFRALCPGRKRFRLAPHPYPSSLSHREGENAAGRIRALTQWMSAAHLFEGKNAGGRKRPLKGETPLPKEPTDATFHHPSMRPPLNCRTCVRPVSTGSPTGAPAGSSAGPAACPPAAAAPTGPRSAGAAQFSPDRPGDVSRRHQHGLWGEPDLDQVRPPV